MQGIGLEGGHGCEWGRRSQCPRECPCQGGGTASPVPQETPYLSGDTGAGGHPVAAPGHVLTRGRAGPGRPGPRRSRTGCPRGGDRPPEVLDAAAVLGQGWGGGPQLGTQGLRPAPPVNAKGVRLVTGMGRGVSPTVTLMSLCFQVTSREPELLTGLNEERLLQPYCLDWPLREICSTPVLGWAWSRPCRQGLDMKPRAHRSSRKR